jgi:hypothetical protein
MTNILILCAVTWVAIAVAVIGLALYRRYVSREEFDTLHIQEAEAGLISQQRILAHRLNGIDYWGKYLTVGAIGYGLVIACLYLYQVWQSN